MKKTKWTLNRGDNVKIMRKMNADSVDLTVTSPPYDSLRTYEGYSFDFESVARELYRITKLGGVVVWVVADATVKGSETGTSFRQALFFKEIGFNLHDTMIYEKSGMAFPEKKRYHNAFEYMFVLSKGTPKTVNIIKDRPNKFVGAKGGNRRGGLCVRREFGARFNIWRYANGRDNSTKYRAAFAHPAVFPEALARDHILSWSNPGELVFDPFAGSGTTLIAALQNGRNAHGVEISSKYYEMILTRIKVETVFPATYNWQGGSSCVD